jgi:hypothetical protein
MSVVRWVLAHKAVSIPVAAVLAAATGGIAYRAATSSAGGSTAPASVTETSANGSATVTWQDPGGTPATGYRVTLYPSMTDRVPRPNLGRNGGMIQVTVSASTRSYTFANLLVDCHQRYEIAVETTTQSGLSQPVYTPSFRPSGIVAAGQDPPYVVVLVDGIRSQSPGFTLQDTYDPTPPGEAPSYCPESWSPGGPGDSAGTEAEANVLKSPTGPWSFLHKWNVGEINSDGTADTSDFNNQWESEPKTLASDGRAGSFTHNFMLDDLAAQGAVILPFSYHTDGCDASTGAQLTGTFSDPVFRFPGYNSGDSFVTDCGVAHIGALGGGFGFGPGVNYWGDVLVHEVTSVHQMWPSSKIVVIGHSQGGLVTADAWLQGFTVPHIQAFSLDSPINGSCGTPVTCIGPPGYPPYEARTIYDQGPDGYLGIDQSHGDNMHFIGTYGDSPIINLPLGINIHAYGADAETLEHQMPFDYSQHDPGSVVATCNVEGSTKGQWPQVNPNCPAAVPDYLSPCPVDFNSVAPWITDTGHFVVKYCPGVITYLNQAVGASATPGPVKPDELAVLGDSYSSGEGSADWISPTGDGTFATKTGGDTCHRSSHAYAVTVLNADVFVACSGSTATDIETGARYEWSQLEHLGPAIKTVVLSAGGDDAGFAGILSACTDSLDLPGGLAVNLPGHNAADCGPTLTTAEKGGVAGGTHYDGFNTIETNLIRLYQAILGPHPSDSLPAGTSANYAPNAHLYVVGYPYLFPPQGFNGCNGISPTNQILLNNATTDLNNMLRDAVGKANSPTSYRITFVDDSGITQNHWICGYQSTPYINDLQFRVSDVTALAETLATPLVGPDALIAALAGIHNCPTQDVSQWQLGNQLGICSKSYHPSPDGTAAIGHKVQQCIQNASTCETSQQPATPWACTEQTFAQLMSNPHESEVSPVGTAPKCLDGYAEMDFTIPNGQPAPFFFSLTAGKWVLVEGGDAIPTKACTVIPHPVMSAWGYNCNSPATNPSSNSSSSSSAGSVAPGHGSPAAVVAGLYQSELAGNWSTTDGVCSYLQPDAQAVCQAYAGGTATGTYHIHATVIQGTQALVEVTGTISAPGSPTVSNSDPASGMPNSQADFQTVFTSLTSSSATIMSPAPCIEVGGQWYADVGG